MRTKSETKRLKILEAASEVFSEMGFERASMSDICARAGFSRATLYSYFPSKDELFVEVMLAASRTEVETLHGALDPATANIEESLVHFGQNLLGFAYSPEILAVRRLAIAQSTRSDFGRVFYARSRRLGENMVANFLKSAMDAGRLRQADPEVATAHLLGLLESEVAELIFRPDLPPLPPERITRMAENAVAVFLMAYGPRS